MNIQRIGVVGLGKLGAPMAAVFAKSGYDVLGGDINADYVEKLQQGVAPVDETDLQAFITLGKERLNATTDITSIGKLCDAIFVIVPSPSDAHHNFSNEYIIDAVKTLGTGIKDSQDPKLVVITSTVMPGSTGGPIKTALEEASGRPLGPNLGLCYNPEFIALGSVIQDMLNPDFILIGESDQKWGETLEAIYQKACAQPPIFKRMNFVNAEITKISVNTYTTTKISYANMLANLCTQIRGADADIVADAVGTDSRIGTKYLKGGVGFGGPCFPRDNKAFISLAQSSGVDATLAEATDTINRQQIDVIEHMIFDAMSDEDTKIGIYGLAYKNGTAVTEASHGWILAERLAQKQAQVFVYDQNTSIAPGGCQISASLNDLAQTVDIIVLMLPITSGHYDDMQNIYDAMNKTLTIVDPWRSITPTSNSKHMRLVQLGVGQGGN